MTKKICIFSAQYLPHMGGVENFTYQLSKKLIEESYEVVVVTSLDDNLLSYEVQEKIKIYRFPSYQLLNGRYPFLKKNKKFKQLKNCLIDENIDYIIINTRFYPLSLFGALFSKKHNIESLVIEHGTAHVSMSNKVVDFFANIYEHVITSFIKKYCVNYYGVSKDCVEWLKHFKICGKGTIHNAINLEEISERLKNTEIDFRRNFKIPKEATVITITSRLLEIKGIPNLLKAFEIIQQKYTNTYLLIAGEGELEQSIIGQNIINVIVLGKLGHDQVIDLLKCSDIFCLASRSEGFSTSVLEAAACRNYLVTTKVGGANEIILNNEYGILLEDNSVENIYDGLERAILLGEKRNKATELVFNHIIKNFTWNHTYEELKSVVIDD